MTEAKIVLAFNVMKSATFPCQCNLCNWWFRDLTVGLCFRCVKTEKQRKANQLWCWKCQLYTNHLAVECESEKYDRN